MMNLPKVICIEHGKCGVPHGPLLSLQVTKNRFFEENGGNSRVACELSSTGGKHRDNVLRMITIDRKYYFRIENVH